MKNIKFGGYLPTLILIPLAALSLIYLALGFHGLIFQENGAGDLLRRYNEQVAIAQGINPNGPIGSGNEPEPSREVGGYPPFSLALWRFLVVLDSFEMTRLYFAALNLVSLALVIVWLNRKFGPHGPSIRAFAILSFLALSPNAVALRLGQSSIIVFALMLGAIALAERQHKVASGFLLALSFLKPQLSAPLTLLLFMRREWIALSITMFVTLLATIFICFQIRETPIALIAQMLEGTAPTPGTAWATAHFGILQFVSYFGVPHRWVVMLSAVIGILLCVVLIQYCKSQSYFYNMSIIAANTAIFTYHRRYDYVLVWVLFVAMLELFLKAPTRTLAFSILAVGMTLWLPITEGVFNLPFVFYGIHLIWIAAMLLFARQLSRHKSSN